MVDIHPKNPMSMCPMASMCKGMADKPPSLLLLMMPGLALIVVGIVILVEPKVLVWLVAVLAIVLGVALLMMAAWFRRMAEQFQGAHQSP